MGNVWDTMQILVRHRDIPVDAAPTPAGDVGVRLQHFKQQQVEGSPDCGYLWGDP